MPLIERLEQKFGWIAIPKLVRIIMCFQVLVFVLVWVQASENNGYPALLELITLNIGKILQGEVWRLVSFVFLPPTFNSLIGMFFAVIVSVLLGDLLETLWGSFGMTLYVLGSMLGTVAGAALVWSTGGGIFLPTSGYLFSGSLLFAAAVYHPNLEFRLFFVIPVKLVWIAIFAGAALLLQVIGMLSTHPMAGVALVLSVANFFVIFVPGFRRAVKMRGELAGRRRKFEGARATAEVAMHECVSCGKTERDDADLVFRVAADGEEYCVVCRAKQQG